MMQVQKKRSEQGQAMAETALFGLLAVIVAFGLLALIPFHRARTAATAAAYGCAQFLSQSPEPLRAARNAYAIAQSTLDADWSGTMGVQYQVRVYPPTAPGLPGSCTVSWSAPILFNIGLRMQGGWTVEAFTSRSESWKAKWR